MGIALSADPKVGGNIGVFLATICGIAIGLTVVGWGARQLLRRSARLSTWSDRRDARQCAVIRAFASTVLWSMALTSWNLLHGLAMSASANGALFWVTFNLPFILLFFVCECVKLGGLAEAPNAGTGPWNTLFSRDELDRIAIHPNNYTRAAADSDSEVQSRSA